MQVDSAAAGLLYLCLVAVTYFLPTVIATMRKNRPGVDMAVTTGHHPQNYSH